VVDVQVAQEDLVQIVVRDLLRGQPFVAPATEVEEELVPVAQFDQEACGSLLWPGAGHPRPQGDDSHLVRSEVLGSRVVDVSVRKRLDGRGRSGLGDDGV